MFFVINKENFVYMNVDVYSILVDDFYLLVF